MKKLSILLIPLALFTVIVQQAAAWTPAPPIKIATHGWGAYEGNDMSIHFSMKNSHPFNRAAWRTCYSYKTEDGTAKSSEGDYRVKSGVVCWNRYASQSGSLTIQALKDLYHCECDETVKIVLSNPRSYTRAGGWGSACGAGGSWPCNFTTTATIKQPSRQCKVRLVCN